MAVCSSCGNFILHWGAPDQCVVCVGRGRRSQNVEIGGGGMKKTKRRRVMKRRPQRRAWRLRKSVSDGIDGAKRPVHHDHSVQLKDGPLPRNTFFYVAKAFFNSINVENKEELATVLAFIRSEIQKLSVKVEKQIAREQSPWMSANSAAQYADCSPSAIFKAANAGLITRHDSFPGPRFKREDIDAAILKGKLK
jgi:hypothetical protein